MKKVLIITADGYEDPELEYPYYRFIEEGYQTDIATLNGKEVLGQFSYPAKNLVKPNKILNLEELKVSDYDLLFIPGGRAASIELKNNKAAVKFVKDFFKTGKLVTSICHGPWVLAAAGILRGLKATCYPNSTDLIEDLKKSGAIHINDQENQPVVKDKNVITSLRPSTLPQFMKAVLHKFEK